MKYKACKDGSYVCNCFVKRREDSPSEFMFNQTVGAGSITAHLNGYAIIPLEEYYELTDRELPSGELDRIKKADIQLNVEKVKK